MKCKTCEWWKDYNVRVWACISTGHSSFARDRIELRLCKYRPNPMIDIVSPSYTDEEYICGSYREVETEK